MSGFRGDDQNHDHDSATTWVAGVNLISHASVRAAVARLQDEHAITNPDNAFDALYRVSRRSGVKLRQLSAAVLDGAAIPVGKAPAAPALSFSLRGRGGRPHPSDVLADLTTTALELTGAQGAVVQVKDAMHGGLCIEGHAGLGEQYRHHFSYVDDGGSAAGRATARCEVVRVDDVSVSPLYSLGDQAVLAAEGVRAELAVPMCDEDGTNRGAVTVVFGARHPNIDPFAIEMLHGHADSCAQWLRWYDATVLPALVAAVHEAAAASAEEAVSA
ncbi:histidine kinase [Mycobacterium sp. 852013-51886_SCH5428379]|uniref:GAF domain-containing protein n=1 Tax=Mycobacterium sp. 852013-51886_SCH5428379 TaxID=1834111 RepID=UPI0007FCD3DA|nr:ANTAR domain-containing protein [Mycobacterium sp. 852013-51886_SCH5428379]OBB60900.1 histidine kinase [Mycobacterium sp. 852013-51886_SCH5428379]